MKRPGPVPVACALLLVASARSYLYLAADAAQRGMASKALGHAAIIALAWLVYALIPARLVLAAALLATVLNGMGVVCPLWYIADPWPIAPGQSMCSARAGFDLGPITLVGIAGMAYWLVTVISDRSRRGPEG